MKIKKVLISCLFIALISLVFGSLSQAIPPKKNLLPSDYSTNLTLKEAVKLKKPIAVNFYVDWCHYCQKFAPTLESLRKQYKSNYSFVMVKVDDKKNAKLAKDFSITSFPSLYLVNPADNTRMFVNQAVYSNPKLLKQQFDIFLKASKK